MAPPENPGDYKKLSNTQNCKQLPGAAGILILVQATIK